MWMLRARKSFSLRHRMPTYQLFAPKLTSTDISSPSTTDIRYITGSDNLVANTFSRISESNLLHFNNFRVAAEGQYSYEELQSLMDSGTRLEFKPLYFTSSEKSLICDVSTGIKLRRHVHLLKPIPASCHCSCPVFVSSDILKAAYVFLRINRICKCLEQSYDGLYEVLSRRLKVVIDDNPVTIPINRLKPAHLFPVELFSRVPSPRRLHNYQNSDVIIRFGRCSRQVARLKI
ncbi:hypothetical protein AVEN_95079-1 [Araneus ventricosus]|uniref:Uncharacterized protein n=1 Tax=Araneus ventricosus TaxID=182803 RepID=A0A4Y2UBS9_ARAVE|nr:hypothetical protein AVEN_95079-1 [Araneus ventricosus]